MHKAVISGTGLFTPPYSISNEELVMSFNRYVEEYNHLNSDMIKSNKLEALLPSSAEFIEKASGIKSRYVMNKEPILDTNIMHPLGLERKINEDSVQSDMSCAAAKEALNMAKINARDIDAVICACSNMPRAYPALAIEIQNRLGIESCFSFDLNVACASAAFALNLASAYITNNTVKNILIVNPEICSAHLNFRDRDSHFIFGDACTAMVVQSKDIVTSDNSYTILDSRLKTQYSENIHNNHGFLSLTNLDNKPRAEKYFVQEGRKVFKEIIPLISNFLLNHINDNALETSDVKRLWIHQANINMNNLIAKKVLGFEPTSMQAPITLDKFANTSSAGSIIAFHKHNLDLESGDKGIISAFGGGYSAGSIILEKN
ncbi:MAG: beta-ketoacyl-ACP synthase III [Francisellaceae bacterium]|nr:beta-ketoacyl-ACP synthase III [Francisellaceae bacterium]MBT6206894.1 beta-ketoacyl-ACP synthase III [Francisellaceae bacterium]MBT6538004.1 beta-ketoacyl-ACP synthase III [Francisellaceae bacterium]